MGGVPRQSLHRHCRKWAGGGGGQLRQPKRYFAAAPPPRARQHRGEASGRVRSLPPGHRGAPRPPRAPCEGALYFFPASFSSHPPPPPAPSPRLRPSRSVCMCVCVCETRLSPTRVILSRPAAAGVSPRWSRCGRPVPGETKAGAPAASGAPRRGQVRGLPARPGSVRLGHPPPPPASSSPGRRRRGWAGAGGCCLCPGERGLGYPSASLRFH